MAKQGFPFQWYWIADDGRIYSSALQKVVDKSDPGYQEFLSLGRGPTIWPRQVGTHLQTNDALLAVIGRYGLSMSPHEALSMYARSKQAAISSGGTAVNIAQAGQKPLIVEVDTSTRGLAVLHADYIHAESNPHEVFHLQQSKGPSILLTGEQIKIVHRAASAFVRSTSRSLSAVLAAITERKITTQAQIDNPPADVTRWPVNT